MPAHLQSHFFDSHSLTSSSDWIDELRLILLTKEVDATFIPQFKLKTDGHFTKHAKYLEFIKLFLLTPPQKSKQLPDLIQIKKCIPSLNFRTHHIGQAVEFVSTQHKISTLQIYLEEKSFGCFSAFKFEEGIIECQYSWNLLNQQENNGTAAWLLRFSVFHWKNKNLDQNYIDSTGLRYIQGKGLFSVPNFIDPASYTQFSIKVSPQTFERESIAISYPLKEKGHLFQEFDFKTHKVKTSTSSLFALIFQILNNPPYEELTYDNETYGLQINESIPFRLKSYSSNTPKMLTLQQYTSNFSKEQMRLHVYFNRQHPPFLDFIEVHLGEFKGDTPLRINFKLYPTHFATVSARVKFQVEVGVFDVQETLVKGKKYSFSNEWKGDITDEEQNKVEYFWLILKKLKIFEFFSMLEITFPPQGIFASITEVNREPNLIANENPNAVVDSAVNSIQLSEIIYNPLFEIALLNNINRIMRLLKINQSVFLEMYKESECREHIVSEYQEELIKYIYPKCHDWLFQKEIMQRDKLLTAREAHFRMFLTQKKQDEIKVGNKPFVDEMINTLQQLYERSELNHQFSFSRFYECSLLICEAQLKLEKIKHLMLENAKMKQNRLDYCTSVNQNKMSLVKEFLAEQRLLKQMILQFVREKSQIEQALEEQIIKPCTRMSRAVRNYHAHHFQDVLPHFTEKKLAEFGASLIQQATSYIIHLTDACTVNNNMPILRNLLQANQKGWDVVLGGSAFRGSPWANDLDIKILPPPQATENDYYHLLFIFRHLICNAPKLSGYPETGRIILDFMGPKGKPINIVLCFSDNEASYPPLYTEDVIARIRPDTTLAFYQQRTTKELDAPTIGRIILAQQMNPIRKDPAAIARVLRDMVYIPYKKRFNEAILVQTIALIREEQTHAIAHIRTEQEKAKIAATAAEAEEKHRDRSIPPYLQAKAQGLSLLKKEILLFLEGDASKNIPAKITPSFRDAFLQLVLSYIPDWNTIPPVTLREQVRGGSRYNLGAIIQQLHDETSAEKRNEIISSITQHLNEIENSISQLFFQPRECMLTWVKPHLRENLSHCLTFFKERRKASFSVAKSLSVNPASPHAHSAPL